MNVATLFEALENSPELNKKYETVQRAIAEVVSMECLNIADESLDAAKARNQINTRQWVATKFKPDKFGDRLDVNQNTNVNITLALGQAKERLLLPVHDISQDLIQQPIDNTKLIDTQHNDGTSVDPTKKASDDIYD